MRQMDMVQQQQPATAVAEEPVESMRQGMPQMQYGMQMYPMAGNFPMNPAMMQQQMMTNFQGGQQPSMVPQQTVAPQQMTPQQVGVQSGPSEEYHERLVNLEFTPCDDGCLRASLNKDDFGGSGKYYIQSFHGAQGYNPRNKPFKMTTEPAPHLPDQEIPIIGGGISNLNGEVIRFHRAKEPNTDLGVRAIRIWKHLENGSNAPMRMGEDSPIEFQRANVNPFTVEMAKQENADIANMCSMTPEQFAGNSANQNRIVIDNKGWNNVMKGFTIATSQAFHTVKPEESPLTFVLIPMGSKVGKNDHYLDDHVQVTGRLRFVRFR